MYFEVNNLTFVTREMFFEFTFKELTLCIRELIKKEMALLSSK